MKQTPRFKIIRKLDAGGMAEVYHAEQESIEGFRKTVAVKKVLPHLVENQKFLRMFLDEARLCLRLNQANIVQVFDVGQAGGSYYIIMEYVDGVSLRHVLDFMRTRGTVMPLEQAVFMMVETCKGLFYAHNLADSDGRPLNIVHRDVSPPNILLSKQGEVKLVDFGLARAADQLEHTDAGIVKGKFSYLSPEAVAGAVVDARADIFAAGILLFESLTGRRLFAGRTDHETIQQVRQAEIPSLSRINPAVPRDLEQIVLRALARELSDRYQTAQELGDDLYQFLFSHGLKVTSFDVAELVKMVLRESKVPAKRPSANIIDELIESELTRLQSIEHHDSPFQSGEKPLSAEEISGGFPGDGSSLEDPRTWAEDLDDGAALRLPEAQKATWRESRPTPAVAFPAVRTGPNGKPLAGPGPAAGARPITLRSRPPGAPPPAGEAPAAAKKEGPAAAVPPRRGGVTMLAAVAGILAAVVLVLLYLIFR
jgi:serine/threonine-protein kinase